MRKPLLRIAFLTAIMLISITVFAPTAAADHCREIPDEEDRKNDGNELVAVYVEDAPPGQVHVDGDETCTEQAWVEVQDDGEHAPVDVEYGWQGSSPAVYGYWNNLDNTINGLEAAGPESPLEP